MQTLYKELSSHFRQISDFLTNTEEEVRLLDKILKQYQVKKVLDVACGVGRHSIPLAKSGYQVTGIDYSKSQIREAKKYAKDNKVDIEFLLKDANDFSFSEKFDAAICMWTTIGEEPMVYTEVIKNVFKALRKNGIFIIDNNSWSRIPKSKEQFIKNNLTTRGLKIKQSIHDRFTEHFRIREANVSINGKLHKDLCVTHIKKPNEWGQELKKAGFKNFKIIPNYQINRNHHKKDNVLIVGVK